MPFLDQDGNEVKVDDKACLQIPVSIELAGNYMDLIRYIKTLHKFLPAMVVVDEIKINKPNPGERQMQIFLNINLYLLS